MSMEEMAKITTGNARRLFRLDCESLNLPPSADAV
jgi:hypothetical protein